MEGFKHKYHVATLRLRIPDLSTCIVSPLSVCQQEMFQFYPVSLDQLILLSVDLIIYSTYSNDF